MRPIVLSALLLAGCPPEPSDDTSDTQDTEDTGDTDDTGTDSDDTDTGTVDTDTGGDTSDTDTGEEAPPTPRELARRWKLVWEDEFDGPTTPDDPCYDAAQTPPKCMNRYWSTETCDPAIHANVADLNKCTWVIYDIYNWMDWGKPLEGKGINKLEQSQVFVENGVLRLPAKPVNPITWEPGDPWPWDCGNGGDESTGWLVTEDCPIVAGAIHSNPDYAPTGFSATYGRFEVRAIIPNQTGAWPAHWLLPEGGDWPDDGEIDIMEAVAHDPSDVHGTFHGGTWVGDPPDGTHVHHSVGNHHDPGEVRWAAGWHVYAVEWDPTELRFFVDGFEIGHVEDGWPVAGDVLGSGVSGVNTGDAWPAFPVEIPSMPFYWILNTSIVPTGGFSLKDFAPVDHQIDWVRYYEACSPEAVDPDCVQRSTGSGDVTRKAWMSGPKWSDEYRVLHTGDFDGDGDGDVLLRTRSAGHATYLLRGQPRGDFLHEELLTAANGMSEQAWSDAFRAGHVGDFDGDGDDDLLLQGRGTGDDTFLLRADGQGGFAAPVTLTNAAGQSGSRWDAAGHVVVVGDFDKSGADDVLLVPRTAAHQARLLLADGQGGFATGLLVTNEYGLDVAKWSAGDHVPVALDLDGDGHDDVLLRNESTSGRTRWLRGGPGGFQGTATDLTTVAGLDAALWADADRVAHVGNFDGDADDDVLLQGRGQGDDTWLVLGGAGGVTSAGSVAGMFGLSLGDWQTTRHVLHVGDVTGDGRDDALLRGVDDAWGTWLVRGGPTGFAGADDVTTAENLGKPQWADEAREGALLDLDGDGRDDVLLRGRTSDDKSYVVFLP